MSVEESLIRMEQKLDLIIYAMQQSNLMLTTLPDLAGIEKDVCALCKQSIKLLVNPTEGVLHRACGCKLPKQAYKLTTLTTEAENANNRTDTIEIPSERTE